MGANVGNSLLYFSVITANLYYITIGMNFAWNSSVLPKLLSNDTDVNPLGKPITLLQVSTLTSVLPFGSIVGTLLIGKLPDIIGRKKTLRYLTLLTISSYFAVFFGSHIYVFIVFLTTVAISTSAAGVVVPVYTTEIVEDRNRGKLGSLIGVFISCGQFFSYLIGPVVPVDLFALICGIPTLLLLILSIFIPESPVYLTSNGNKTEAIRVLKKLRRHQSFDQVEEEYTERQPILQNRTGNALTSNFRDIFRSRSGRKSFFISLGIILLHESCGIYIIISYLAPLFNEAGGELSGETLAVLLAATKIPISAASLSVIEKLGRRFLILFASFICGTSMFVFGLYLSFKNSGLELPVGVHVVPIVCIITFVIVYTFGLGSVPLIVMSELLPNEFRAMGTLREILHL